MAARMDRFSGLDMGMKSRRRTGRGMKVPDWCSGVYFVKNGAVIGRGRLALSFEHYIGVLPDDDEAKAFFNDRLTAMNVPLHYSAISGESFGRLRFEQVERYKDTTVVGVELHDIDEVSK